MRGGDTVGLRAFNERMIITALLRSKPLSKAEIARKTGLSGQAATVIVNRLIEEGLLEKRMKIRGQIGQPSTPIAPKPDGAFSLGLKIGRRSVEAVLVNFVGEIVAQEAVAYHAPLPEPTMATSMRLAEDLLGRMTAAERRCLVGIGIAMPDHLAEWSDELGLPAETLAAWNDLDVPQQFTRATGVSATRYNDATAACAAEMMAGSAIVTRTALYLYLGTFVGGGVVIDGKLFFGEQRNAGAIASLPVSEDGRVQLLQLASAFALEDRLGRAGVDVTRSLGGDVPEAEPPFEAWLATAAPALARAIAAGLSVIDFQTVVIDGVLNDAWRARIVHRVTEELEKVNRAGLAPATIAAGGIGRMARVLGAALLPLHARFSPDTELLVRGAASNAGEDLASGQRA